MKARMSLLGVLLFVSSQVFAAGMTIDDLKMEKRFGIGVSAAGALAMFGIEVDINVTENFSVTGGVGTGIDYSTFTVKGKYYMPGKYVSPYIGFGFARWWTDGTTQTKLGPSILMKEFLAKDVNLQNGFSVFMIYPALGVQFLKVSGFSFNAEVQYLIKLFSLANGAYAGAGVHWYF